VLSDDAVAARPSPPEGRLTVDLGRGERIVTDRDGPSIRVTTRAHREAVVRRLLGRGLSVQALVILLPGWRGLIEQVAVDR
jgi:hypothetical protein